MSDRLDLHRELLLDHARRPRNCRAIIGADRTARGANPSCGDQLTVWLRLDAGAIADAAFQGSGCSISLASASIMTESIRGRSVEEAIALFRRFHALMAARPDGEGSPADGETSEGVAEDEWGKLAAFQGVRRFPVRVKCATLAWHTLHAALAGGQEQVTTE